MTNNIYYLQKGKRFVFVDEKAKRKIKDLDTYDVVAKLAQGIWPFTTTEETTQ
jgi:hypothetical protein